MKMQFDLRIDCLNKKINHKATALGWAAMIMGGCRRSANFQIRTLYHWIAPAVDHGQIMFLFNRASVPLGFVIWAHLASDSEQRLLNDLNFILHPCEWNEGGRTWIIDYCFPAGAVRESLPFLRKRLHDEGVTHVNWARRYTDYSIRKVTTYRIG